MTTKVIAPIPQRPDDLGMDEAFGRDKRLQARVRDLIAAHGVRTVIETGSWRGYTTRRLAEMEPVVGNLQVITIDIDHDMNEMAAETIAGIPNARAVCGDSPSELRKLIPGLRPANRPVMYYLDAHWMQAWPLFEELEAIAELDKGPAVIVVHDIQVPGTSLGFDSYGGRALTLELIRPLLDKLKFKWVHAFNDDSAEGHRRGALFITSAA